VTDLSALSIVMGLMETGRRFRSGSGLSQVMYGSLSRHWYQKRGLYCPPAALITTLLPVILRVEACSIPACRAPGLIRNPGH